MLHARWRPGLRVMPADQEPAPLDLTAQVKAKARQLGFEAVAIARADQALEADFDRYLRFIDQGMHGEMGWLADWAEARRRLDTESILAGAKSVVCLARRYQRSAAAEASDPPLAQSIARYARGRDYHGGVRKKLRKLATFLRTLDDERGEGSEARPIADDAPILERAWAARAGLGFVGKNGMLIVPGQGSFVLLGEVVTTLRLEPDAPIKERCGACTRCLDACPTAAFERPFVLDPRRCIAYLTIEHRSAIPTELRLKIGDHLFGCDDCQVVCPFNSTASPKLRDEDATRPFQPHPRWGELALSELLDPNNWARASEGSPVRRATAEGLARNSAILMAHRGDRSAEPLLAAAASNHPSAMVRETCQWAVDVLRLRASG